MDNHASSDPVPLPAVRAGSRRISQPGKHRHHNETEQPVVTSLVSGLDPQVKIVSDSPNSPVDHKLSCSPKLNNTSDHNTKLYPSTFIVEPHNTYNRGSSGNHQINQPR
ncbi:hypothetical protein SAMD00019534_047460, partial [Acytostelium subglobosum LB1]|uniref:hypothetical protein n=1 Tax=Acytostelium subglobosum LB1 TaxID=1410327 RepID=UPI000644FB96